MNKTILLSFITILSFLGSKASESSLFWKDDAFQKESMIKASSYRSLTLDFEKLKKYLLQAPVENLHQKFSSTFELDIPLPEGGFETYLIQRTNLMEASLQKKYEGIKTFNGFSKTNALRKITLDFTYQGFHAYIRYNGNSIYIDPFTLNNTTEYICYYRSDFQTANTPKINEGKPLDPEGYYLSKKETKLNGGNGALFTSSGSDLRTYRLAVAATGQYTAFHGGTVPLALSAIQTTVARVNQVYENDISVRFILVDNNDTIIFTNSTTDPYTNFNAGTDLSTNPSICNSYIGTSNYDVGHVFTTGAGGLASLGVPCTASKAQGVTGIANPIGDPYDIDYVAHELGHQFGANHTFNGTTGSCSGFNRNGSTAYEPGSGSTIMGYAGICGAVDNIQNNSDDHFHNASYNEMVQYITTGSGNSCPTITNNGNTPPTSNAGTATLTIPISTPFELLGSATDVDGDSITYNWEEWDLGPAGNPGSPSGNAPLFRSFPSQTTPLRTFPQISDIVNNTSSRNEVLPTYSRQLRFRLTVRDNVGGASDDQINHNATSTAGPFVVTSPNTTTTWGSQAFQQVEWDVANTTAFPVSCATVDIMLSRDGGFTYPDTLATDVPNIGSAIVLIPNVNTNQARIKVKGHDHIFFDISNQNFNITPATGNNFSMLHLQDTVLKCAPDDAQFDFYFSGQGGFNSPLTLSVSNLPSGATSSFSNNNFAPNGTSTLTISNTSAVASGNYNIFVTATGGGITRVDTVTLTLINGAPGNATAIAPTSSTNGSITPIFIWSAVPGAETYRIEIASDQAFSNLIWAAANITDTFYIIQNILDPSSSYYWRVQSNSSCGIGTFNTPVAFSTGVNTCFTYTSSKLPALIPFVGEVLDTFNVTGNGTVSDVNITELIGTHGAVKDLKVSLIAPSGKTVVLMDQLCDNRNDFNIRFDDQATSDHSSIPCPPKDGNVYQPQDFLSSLIDENVNGNWILKLEDLVGGNNGVFNQFSFELCTTDGKLSTNEKLNTSFAIFPNPTNKDFTIQIANFNENFNGIIYSSTGQVVSTFIVNTKSQRIDVSNLSKGIYHVNLWNEKNNTTQKLIIK